MTNIDIYQPLIDKLQKTFADRLKTVVLFGSRARGPVSGERDHDIFMVIDNLPAAPLERLKEVRFAIRDVDLKINTVAKTPEEVAANLTSLLVEICVDGICLCGCDYFEPYRQKARRAIEQAGLKRKRVGKEWYWTFERMPEKEWELTWDGYREYDR